MINKGNTARLALSLVTALLTAGARADDIPDSSDLWKYNCTERSDSNTSTGRENCYLSYAFRTSDAETLSLYFSAFDQQKPNRLNIASRSSADASRDYSLSLDGALWATLNTAVCTEDSCLTTAELSLDAWETLLDTDVLSISWVVSDNIRKRFTIDLSSLKYIAEERGLLSTKNFTIAAVQSIEEALSVAQPPIAFNLSTEQIPRIDKVSARYKDSAEALTAFCNPDTQVDILILDQEFNLSNSQHCQTIADRGGLIVPVALDVLTMSRHKELSKIELDAREIWLATSKLGPLPANWSDLRESLPSERVSLVIPKPGTPEHAIFIDKIMLPGCRSFKLMSLSGNADCNAEELELREDGHITTKKLPNTQSQERNFSNTHIKRIIEDGSIVVTRRSVFLTEFESFLQMPINGSFPTLRGLSHQTYSAASYPTILVNFKDTNAHSAIYRPGELSPPGKPANTSIRRPELFQGASRHLKPGAGLGEAAKEIEQDLRAQ